MSNPNHPWCRDVPRDEAIRAAEDAAAAERTPVPDHRDLPAAVAELRERVARIEGHCRIEATKQARLWAAVIPKSVSGSSAEGPENKGDTMPAEGLRTERVTLEVTHAHEISAECWDWSRDLAPGESVRVVEEPAEIALLTAERDLARAVRDGLRSQRDAARARVAELETAPAASGAAVGTCNTFCGERECERTDPTQCKRGEPQPARGGLTAEEREASTEDMKCMTKLRRERDEANAECERLRVAHLKAALERDRANEARGRIRSEWTRRGQSLHAAQQTIGALNARVAELEAAYSSECDARAQAHRELSDLAAAVRERESGEECDHSYAAQCREAAAARDRADRMMPAPAANAGGEAKQEPVAWGFATPDGKLMHVSTFAPVPGTATVVPLYAAPQPPRGWLTAEERSWLKETLDQCCKNIDARLDEGNDEGAALVSQTCEMLRGILARSTPPKVKVPPASRGETPLVRDLMWGQAIREAGGEVEE